MYLSGLELQEMIARCRRLADVTTDYDVRHALEELAEEYQARLPRRGAGFMLQRKDG